MSVHRVLMLALLVACGAPQGASSRSLAAGECTDRTHCGRDDYCAPPGSRVCGGAEDPPTYSCPPDRPHYVQDECGGACVSEAPRSCTEGFACEHGGICAPERSDRDEHGCVHVPCDANGACEAGFCIAGRCYDAPGRCEGMPVTQEEPPPPPEPVAITCPEGTYEVERCVTGGMPVQTPDGPRANRSCTTQCDPTPPTGTPGMMCAQLAERRFRCEGFAP